MSTGQYSHMMDSPTSWNWLTQEVRRSVRCTSCWGNIVRFLLHGAFSLSNSPSVSFVPSIFSLSVSFATAGGVAELAGKFHIAKPQYGLCKVASVETGGPRIALISWVSGRRAHGVWLAYARAYRVKETHTPAQMSLCTTIAGRHNGARRRKFL